MKKILLAIAIMIMPISAQPSSFPSLIGQITNGYNVRDDIIHYLQTIVPKLSSKAFYAAVRIASNQHKLYYQAKSFEEAKLLTESTSIAIRCLGAERKDDYKIFKTIERMMTDTPERKAQVMNVCGQFFSQLGVEQTTLSKEEINQRCEARDY